MNYAYANYTCPVCDLEMARDLVAFLSHTGHHIHEAVQQKQPELIGEDGSCGFCGRFGEAVLAFN